MSSIAVRAFAEFRQVDEGPAIKGLAGDPNAFNKVRQSVNPTSEAGLAQPIDGRQPSTPMVSSSSLPEAPSPTDLLAPRLDYLGNSLSRLNLKLAGAPPANVPEPFRARLQLLESKFQSIGQTLENGSQRDPLQLLKLQNDMYQIDEELELLCKFVDQATGGVRTLLQTQI